MNDEDTPNFSYCPVCITWQNRQNDPPKVEERMSDQTIRWHHHQCVFALEILRRGS